MPTKGTENPRHLTRDGRGQTIILPLNPMPSDWRPGAPAGESFDVPSSDFGDTQTTDWANERINGDQAEAILARHRLLPSEKPALGPEAFL